MPATLSGVCRRVEVGHTIRAAMGSHHSGVDPDRPLRALFAVGIPAQLIRIRAQLRSADQRRCRL